MPSTTALIIGAGQTGLAMSRCLTERSIDHVILERGRVANSWSTERWDSLRLLTPNWQSRLPGWQYQGNDHEGYMTMPEVTRYLSGYAASFAAPIQEETAVLSVNPIGDGSLGWSIDTDQGHWFARCVIVATGACSTPAIPALADGLPGSVHQLAPTQYRNPDALPEGGVLVVGSSASGLQIADELARSGREVTLAVGRHTRIPRMYRGMDVQWWLDATGILDQRHDQVTDVSRARRDPSLGLIGSPEKRSLDLEVLADRGVRLCGHLSGIDGATVSVADDLDLLCRRADAALDRLLRRFDQFAASAGMDAELDPPRRYPRITPSAAPERFDLRADGIRTVLWATGFRPHYPWLKADVFDHSGHIRHDGGVVENAPGMYVMGLPFMRRRKSTFIDGAGDDARDLSTHLANHLDRVSLPA